MILVSSWGKPEWVADYMKGPLVGKTTHADNAAIFPAGPATVYGHGLSLTLKLWTCRWDPAVYEQSSWSFMHKAYLKNTPPSCILLSHAAIRLITDLSGGKLLYMLQTHSTWVVFAPSLFHTEMLQSGRAVALHSHLTELKYARTYVVSTHVQKYFWMCLIYGKWLVQTNVHTRMLNVVSLVWGLLRLAPIKV